MNGKFASIAVAIMFFNFFSEAQSPKVVATEIYGTVVDAKTKEVLPYVNVRLKGPIKEGVQTDKKGYYYIRTIAKVDSISFSLAGYETLTSPVIKAKVQEINVPMKKLPLH